MANPAQRTQGWIGLIMLLSAVGMIVSVYLGLGAGPDAGPEPGDEATPGEKRRVSLLLATEKGPPSPLHTAFALVRPWDLARVPVATRFDFPLGTEHGALTYDAQSFGQNGHLGDDLNGIGGEDSDWGDAIYAAGAGRVLFAGWASDGWGNVVLLAHRLPEQDGGGFIQTMYAHLEDVLVGAGEAVHRGDLIGTVGKGAGQYLAHLHFEVRNAATVNPAGGYSEQQLDRVPPSQFLHAQRGVAEDSLGRAPRLPGGGGGETIGKVEEAEIGGERR